MQAVVAAVGLAVVAVVGLAVVAAVVVSLGRLGGDVDGDAPKRFVCSINWHVMQQHARVRALGVGGQHALREEPPPIVPKTLMLAWMQARWSCILPILGGALLSYVRLPELAYCLWL